MSELFTYLLTILFWYWLSTAIGPMLAILLCVGYYILLAIEANTAAHRQSREYREWD